MPGWKAAEEQGRADGKSGGYQKDGRVRMYVEPLRLVRFHEETEEGGASKPGPQGAQPRARQSDHEALQLVSDSMKAGAAGVSIGRNVFQHRKQTLMTRALVEIVHNGISPTQALSIIGERSERILARA